MTEIVSFGEWVQTRRNQLGLTRNRLAEQISCSPHTIKKIERDERRPSSQIAWLLATYLQVHKHEQEDFVRWARGEFVANFRGPADMPMLGVQRVEGEALPNIDHFPLATSIFLGRETELHQLDELFVRFRSP